MKRKKIIIKNNGIVIEVPRADKYIFQFNNEKISWISLGLIEEGIVKYLHSKEKVLVLNAPLEHIFCFKKEKR